MPKRALPALISRFIIGEAGETKLRLMVEINRQISTSQDLGEMLNFIADSVGEVIAYDAAGIFLLGPKGDTVRCVVARGYDESHTGERPISSHDGIVGWAITTGESVLASEVTENPYYLNWREETRSQLTVPIRSDGKGLDIAGINMPSRNVGGDYFDFIPIVPGHLGVVVADVVGKGVPASLIMASFRAFLRAEIRNNYAIQTIFTKVNKLLHKILQPYQFVTAFYGVLDLERRRFTYSNAGHHPAILLRPDGKRRHLKAGGTVTGPSPLPVAIWSALLSSRTLPGQSRVWR